MICLISIHVTLCHHMSAVVRAPRVDVAKLKRAKECSDLELSEGLFFSKTL